jgi:hypothetical protein
MVDMVKHIHFLSLFLAYARHCSLASVDTQIFGALQGGIRQQGLHFESLFWSVLKDSKKWEDSFALCQELENKKGRGNGNASMGDAIDLDAQGLALATLKARAWQLVPGSVGLQATRPRPTSPGRPTPWRSKKPLRSS